MKYGWILYGLLTVAVPVLAKQEPAYFKGKGPVTTEQLMTCLQAQGLGKVGAEIEKQLVPGLRLASVNNVVGTKETGSKFGGRPALPVGVEWPAWQGTNLMFLAQVNLKELQAAAPRAELPANGLLLFFYDASQSTWGFDPKDKGSWRVIFSEGDAAVAKWPAKLPADARVKEAPMRFQPIQTLPLEPYAVRGFEALSESLQDRFYKVVDEFSERNKPMHQLLGNAVPIQSAEMALQCQLVSNGLYCGDATGYNDARAKKLAAGAKDWVLLAMIDTDEPRGWMWGDGGCLYFWIRQDDLKARRFENTWLVLQCH